MVHDRAGHHLRRGIDFGLDTTYGMVAPVDLVRTDYRTVLVGMKPGKTYHFRVVASDGTTTYASEDHLLATGAKTPRARL